MSQLYPSQNERLAFIRSIEAEEAKTEEIRAFSMTPRGREMMCYAQDHNLLKFPMLLKLDPERLDISGSSLSEKVSSLRLDPPRLDPELRETLSQLGFFGLQSANALDRYLQRDAEIHVCRTDGSEVGSVTADILDLDDQRRTWENIRAFSSGAGDVGAESRRCIRDIDAKLSDAARQFDQKMYKEVPEQFRSLVGREVSYVRSLDKVRSMQTEIPELSEIVRSCDQMSRSEFREKVADISSRLHPRSEEHKVLSGVRSSLSASAGPVKSSKAYDRALNACIDDIEVKIREGRISLKAYDRIEAYVGIAREGKYHENRPVIQPILRDDQARSLSVQKTIEQEREVR